MLYPREGRSARLVWRIRAFFLGAVLGLTGIYFDASWLLTAAVIVLAGGMALRVGRSRDPEGGEEESGGPPE